MQFSSVLDVLYRGLSSASIIRDHFRNMLAVADDPAVDYVLFFLGVGIVFGLCFITFRPFSVFFEFAP